MYSVILLMVHVRQYLHDKPTKTGIALTTKEWRQLMERAGEINDQLATTEQELLEMFQKLCPLEAVPSLFSYQNSTIGLASTFASLKMASQQIKE